jgi:polar amino acid transport system substrate-binding protein
MRKFWAFTGLLLGVFTLTCQAETPTNQLNVKDMPAHLLLGAEDSWPPYSDAQGQGISTQLIIAAFAKSGLTPSFTVLPYARVLHDLASGKIDGGYNVTLQSTTREKFIFGEVPLVTVEAYWFFLPDKHPNIQSIDAIPAKFRVGVIRDYEYGDAYENHRLRFTEVKVTQQSQLLRMLKQGRIDAAVMFDREAEFALKQMKWKSTIFDKRFLNHRGDVYLAFSPLSPNAKWLAKQLDLGLTELKKTGEYDLLTTIRPLSNHHKRQ